MWVVHYQRITWGKPFWPIFHDSSGHKATNSHQVSRLEKSIGTALFNRNARTVSLTHAGKVLLEHSRRVFIAIDNAIAATRLASNPDSGVLRVGASITACQYLVPEALREFRESFPAYTLRVTPGDGPAVAQALVDGSIELGILVRHDRQSKLRYHDLFQDELGFIVSPLLTSLTNW